MKKYDELNNLEKAMYGCRSNYEQIVISIKRIIPDGTVFYLKDTPPPIPESTCGFCPEPCGNEHCCMKGEK